MKVKKEKQKLVVIGNGMVGHHFLEQLVEKIKASFLKSPSFVRKPGPLMTAYICPIISPGAALKIWPWAISSSTMNGASS